MMKAAHEYAEGKTDWSQPDALDNCRALEQGYLTGQLGGFISLLEFEASAQDKGLEESQLTPSP